MQYELDIAINYSDPNYIPSTSKIDNDFKLPVHLKDTIDRIKIIMRDNNTNSSHISYEGFPKNVLF